EGKTPDGERPGGAEKLWPGHLRAAHAGADPELRRRGNRNGVYPPDTNGDVGPNHFVQIINLSFQIFNKSGVSLYGPANNNTLWSGFGGPCEAQNSGDPIGLYDSIADRWLLSQFTSSAPYGECIAISSSGDPTGSYYRYFFQFSNTLF